MEVVTSDEEIKLPSPVWETVSLEADISSQKDIGLPSVEPTVSVLEEGVYLVAEESLPREGIAPAIEVVVFTVSSEMINFVIVTGELEVPIASLSLESTQASSYLAITQGNYRLRLFLFLLQGWIIGFNY